jgi:sphingomyelin phosphodiesterase acid-like 3
MKWVSLFFLILLFSTKTIAGPQVLTISDIHFNPFANCPVTKNCLLVEKLNQAAAAQWPQIFAQYGGTSLPNYDQSTNYALFLSLLVQIQQQQPQNVIILGDFLAHRFRTQYLKYSHDNNRSHYENFVLKTLQYLTSAIQQTLPENAAIYPVIGNNDSYGGKDCAYPDYCTITNGSFYRSLANLWSGLFKNEINKAQFLDTFPQAGYYEIILPNTRNHIIILNTVIFSNKAQGPQLDHTAQNQLQWLQKKLQDIAENKEKTWLIFHIPPGIDAYSTSKSFFGIVIPFWNKEYMSQFSQLVHQYNSVITGVFSGHTHMDGFLILDLKNSNRMIVDTFIPSISPIFGNNPAYKFYDYDPASFLVKDFSTYYLNLSQKPNSEWKKEYNFSAIYQTTGNLYSGYKKITRHLENPFTSQYQKFYSTDTLSQPINQGKWNFYWCATSCLDANNYQRCAKEK